MKTIKTRAVNDDIQAGDLVISTPDSDYPGYIGRVLCINLLGSEAHKEETENETDDVHVNFLEFDYSKKRIKEIEDIFSDLYGEKKRFGDCALDDVIMAPCELIRITGIDKKKLDVLLKSGYNAVRYCYTILSNLAYAVTSVPTIPGKNNANLEWSDFSISRRINGYELKATLTKQELTDAFNCQKRLYDFDSIFVVLESMELEGTLNGRSAAEIFADETLMKQIVEEFEETRDGYDTEWRKPVTAAIQKCITNNLTMRG